MTPNLLSAYKIAEGRYNSTTTGLADGTYRIARPCGCAGFLQRLTWAWRVFTGRYDALIWPGQEDRS